VLTGQILNNSSQALMIKNTDLVKYSYDILTDLESKIGETIGLGIFDSSNLTGVVLSKAQGTSGFSYHLDINYHFPLHTSAPGKIFLAYLASKEQLECLDKITLRAYTPSTIVDMEVFKEELNSVLTNGYAIDVGEQIIGCHCVGAPIFAPNSEQVIAVVWTTGPSSLLPVRSFEKLAEMLKKSANHITKRLNRSENSNDIIYIESAIKKAIIIIEQHGHCPINIAELAAELYVGYSWFRRVFKQQVGFSPAQYHQKIRMDKAKELLQNSHLTIKQVANSLGFKNQNHFSSLFKRVVGIAPKCYRFDADSKKEVSENQTRIG
jgi:DNA-binding IclR family transcriptional regulator/AraC-like DNA-binding protein